MGLDVLAEAVTYFIEVENIEQRQQASRSTMTSELLGTALQTAEAKIEDICSAEDVRNALQAYLDDIDQAAADLELLKGLSSADEALKQQIAEHEAQVIARQENPRYRLAQRYLGTTSLSTEVADQGTETTGFSIAEALSSQTEDMLSLPPERLAEVLKGRTLSYKGKKVVITDIRAQDGTFNQKYLSTRPLFGANRRDVYIASVMGGNIQLFFRAGDVEQADSCVSIQGANHHTGKLTNANAVATTLGLPKEHVGNVRFNEDGSISLVDLEARKKVKK